MAEINNKLPVSNFFVNYYGVAGKKYPWRQKNISPFKSLITEMLLRQTQAYSVDKIWEEFTSRYPTPHSIVKDDNDNIRILIKELGLYNQRIKALNQVSKWLINNFDGNVPHKLGILMEGPHVGKYCAKALRCFALNKREEIVDVNILRFLSRFFGREMKSKDVRQNRWAWDVAKSILPSKNIREHNYGLLDFCSNICKSRNPKCKECPLSTNCKYYAKLE